MSNEKLATIVIVDTGCANLSSVWYAVERLGFQATITDDAQKIKSADKVIFPGVGTAQHAMKNIRNKGLVETLQQLTQPVLGFCLGMQLMAANSQEGNALEENAETIACLNIIPVDVIHLDSAGLRLPHMGWNNLVNIKSHPVLDGLTEQDYVYFVHSYGVPVSEFTIASCDYGKPFSAVIAKDNFVGCQFHPERSSQVGQRIIRNFLTM
ncbi:imidazole glycerol phosphate synthase subunit HisH [Thalassotalea fusca]